MLSSPKVQLCGLRPTGQLHIGHYFSVIEPALAGSYVLVATYHSPDECVDVESTLRRFGVPRKLITRQEEIFNPSLYFSLLSVASIGELERMTQYKSNENKTAHLLTYPVLMTHDICGYDEIIVGEDQQQHLEFSRELLRKYNNKFQHNILVPTAKIIGGRIRSLSDPSKKMSKSDPQGCLFLDDNEATIRKKIRRAVMDEEGRNNLIDIYKRVGGIDIPEMNSELKDRLTERLVRRLVIK